MWGKYFFIVSSLLALIFSIGAAAEEVSGKTADGCSYKVINGQYLTNCPSKGASASNDSAPNPAVESSKSATAASAIVTSYSDVPVRKNLAAAAPSLPPQQPVMLPAQGARGTVSSSLEKAEEDYSNEPFADSRRNRLRSKLLDQTFVGLQVGASNVKETNSGSAPALGLNLGTNLDETFGVELGYSYGKQKLSLGLASRGSNTDAGQQLPLGGANDAALSTHLFSGEVQAHLTDPVKRLRPYVGAGLAWRTSTLSENSIASAFGQSLSGGSLHQSTLGGMASAGTKLRIARSVHLGFALRYFLPIVRQDARLEQPTDALPDTNSANATKLTQADDSLTGSSQYQVFGGVQVSF